MARRTPPPERPVPAPGTPGWQSEIRRRQKARAIVTALLLFGFVLLVYAISIVKMLRHA